ncbi:PDDEXK nuclease domain-containing protein [Dyadobacter fanqingshengii]|uniref:PDDEXK nuclease domain-containing protein n=1 Tax=Dyadobacter fanqingshengii TaxID=2906443 RepID=A0A9X1T841_9BACT|nr:PDDEXK nuclease domain-containing protein [Dyadobacter fanqingshengii]MCF0039003.1 PDDEXK nuclease domain-containing protein [Dyadobacter fanqingshengii]USJ34175.1 PDDEXK nuclease domain-containing protein [Dyadobacter fanqingshengii]
MKNYNVLVNAIEATHTTLHQNAIKAINKHVTLKNWLVGFYIVEFEQNGEDKAKYGDKLLQRLSDSLNQNAYSARNLRLCRQFYLLYPEISQIIGSQLGQLGIGGASIWQLPIAKLLTVDNELLNRGNAVFARGADNGSNVQVDLEKLIDRLSYTHLVQLFPLNSTEKRSFYESECIKGNWSVSELKRQINTLYYERSGMSIDSEKLSLHVNETSEKANLADLIKSPFTFEFLGLKAKEVVYENDLQQALIDNLEEFLIELGHGFCFEAKQKRITIGGEYFFIDLVFYHRILKCHVLVELKTNEAKHEHIGQLKTYINYYKKDIMQPNDNPPVGLLLVTDQNKALIEYAVADSDMPLFVSKYIVELPTKEELEIFIKKELAQH